MFRIRIIISKYSPFNRNISNYNDAKELSLKILKLHGFQHSQGVQALNSIESLLRLDTHEIIDKSLISWKRNVLPKKKIFNYEDFIHVFYAKESRLLLVDENYIENRVHQLLNLDILNGKNDLWKVFQQSPAGFFLQDWKEFLKNYYYITYKILPHLNSDANQQIHPLIQHPQSIEQTYLEIKTRFIFAQRTGFNANKTINLKTLLLSSPKDFIQIYAPYCTIEEFNALETLNSTELGNEDDELFDNLVQLSPQHEKSMKKNQSFLKKSIEEGLLLSN